MTKFRKIHILPYLLCFIFFIAYSILSIVRHQHYQSYGYDLGINDQIIWEYSNFKVPITTIDHVPDISKLQVHVEFIYALIAPFYWIWSTRRMLLILEAFFVCFGGIFVYLLAKKEKFKESIALALLLAYLLFYGVQNALWFDVHSVTFSVAFTAGFIYFLVSGKTKRALLFFLLAISAKENVASITFLISFIYFLKTKSKTAIYFAVASLMYLAIIFGIYFPYFVPSGYRFENPEGLFSNLNPLLLYNSDDKLRVYFYTFLSYGFLPLLAPLYLIPVLGNLASYFVLGNTVSTAQGLFLQYRIELAPLMSWATIEAIKKYKLLNTWMVAVYLVCSILFVQYTLHLPLSYLTKSWFWQQPTAVKSIQQVIVQYLPPDAAVVAQNNIIPHISHRYQIYSLYPQKKEFSKNSPCASPTCNWFYWAGNPQFLLVDTSTEWDIRHLLANREDFIDGLKNLETAGVVVVYKRIGTTTLYKVMKSP